MDKAQLRQLIRERKQRYSHRELEEMSAAIADRLLAHPMVGQSQTILLYASLPDEVQTRGLVERLHRMGKTILLPKVVADGEMEVRRYEGPESMAEGAFHIMEPVRARFTDYAAIPLALVPGMAFDREGNRLGRGKGYYDRFLMRMPHLYKIGVCFDFQKVEAVPATPTDVRMDEVV